MYLVGIADLPPAAARTNLARVGWQPQQTSAQSLDDACRSGTTHIGDDWRALAPDRTGGGMSVASVALRGEPTGVASCWNADVVATAKRDLNPGDMLDGEGGFTVWGKLLPAATSAQMGGLPLGLAHDVKVVRALRKGQSLCWDDVAIDTTTPAYKVRQEMEALFGSVTPKE